MTDVQARLFKIIAFIAFVGICIFATLDIITDIREGVSVKHLTHEIGLWLLSLVGIILQFKIISSQNKKIQRYTKELNEVAKEKEIFRSKIGQFSGEFMRLIDEQFNQWMLTPGEKDVGLLLIKGLSMKEIAELRHTNEATVRQQASSIYRKSGLGGRQELAAFFLDDLLIIPTHNGPN